MELPFYVLGYTPTKLFSVADERGREFLPLFTLPERAERYRLYFTTRHELQLRAFLVTKLDAAINLLDRVLLSGSLVEFVAIDPKRPDLDDRPALCQKLTDCIRQLRRKESSQKARRRDQNGRPPRRK